MGHQQDISRRSVLSSGMAGAAVVAFGAMSQDASSNSVSSSRGRRYLFPDGVVAAGCTTLELLFVATDVRSWGAGRLWRFAGA